MTESLLWTPPEPRELAGLREELADQMRHPMEHTALTIMLARGRGTINPDPANPARAATLLLEDERRRLSAAALYSVTDEMTAIAVQAGRKLPTWEIRPEHLPAPAGFMVFGKPIGTYHNDEQFMDLTGEATVEIVAVSWGPSGLVQHTDGHLWVTFWSVTDHESSIRTLRNSGRSVEEARREEYSSRADLTWDNEVLLNYGSAEIRIAGEREAVDPADASLVAAGTAAWMQTVRATWLLCKSSAKSKIADVTEEHLPRTLRRRAERAGHANTDAVRVVRVHASRLHSHEEKQADGRGGYTVKVRSFVRGHVRMQPYPSRNEVEPIWIEPHLRGPQGAPFKTTPATVNLLDRPPGGRPPLHGK